MVYVYHSFLIHSSADGHLGCYLVHGEDPEESGGEGGGRGDRDGEYMYIHG